MTQQILAVAQHNKHPMITGTVLKQMPNVLEAYNKSAIKLTRLMAIHSMSNDNLVATKQFSATKADTIKLMETGIPNLETLHNFLLGEGLMQKEDS